jgi:hypothetical protein
MPQLQAIVDTSAKTLLASRAKTLLALLRCRAAVNSSILGAHVRHHLQHVRSSEALYTGHVQYE